jgi:uncharacterized coiled-coil protein SlyX
MSLVDEKAGLAERAEIPSEAQVRHESMLINEISLILAEKRTALSVLRTGLAVLVLPISVVSVLVAVSRHYDPAKVAYLLAPLLALSLVLAVLGLFLVFRSFKKAIFLDKLNQILKNQNPQLRLLAQMMDKRQDAQAKGPPPAPGIGPAS